MRARSRGGYRPAAGADSGIAQASAFQADEIANVSEAFVQLEGMTQHNAALVEQSTAAAHSLREQTRRLAITVPAFRLTAP